MVAAVATLRGRQSQPLTAERLGEAAHTGTVAVGPRPGEGHAAQLPALRRTHELVRVVAADGVLTVALVGVHDVAGAHVRDARRLVAADVEGVIAADVLRRVVAGE